MLHIGIDERRCGCRISFLVLLCPSRTSVAQQETACSGYSNALPPQNDRRARPRLGVEALEDRTVPAIVFTDTYTLTDVAYGGTAELTVTVDEIGGLYEWDYQIQNISVEYTPYDPQYDIGIGLFGMYTAPGSVIPTSVTSPSGWEVYVGDVHGDPGLLRWMAFDGISILPGGSAEFSFQTYPVDILVGWAEISDPSYAAGGGGPAVVPGEAPTIDLRIAGQDDATEDQAPGKKIHINDNLDEGQQTATSLISDYRPDPVTGLHQIKDGDADLASATLHLKSAVKDWSLDWTYDAKVKVWYKAWFGANAGKWFEAVDRNFNDIPVPAQIELRIEGIDIGAGSIKAELQVNNGNLKVSDQAAVTVYTGLRITGAKADPARVQVVNATGWTVTHNANGDVWRTGSVKNPLQWQKDAQGYIDSIFLSHRQTAIAAENLATIRVGNFDLRAIDPDDIAVLFAADTRFGAGAIVHEIVEQYNGQVLGKNYDDSHAAGIVAECKIVAGGGTRTVTPEPVPGQPGKVKLTHVYQGGIIIIIILDPTAVTNISDVTVQRP
jgi:hypothetical protein